MFDISKQSQISYTMTMQTKKILIIGANGLLGHEFKSAFTGLGLTIDCPDRSIFDITNASQVLSFLGKHSPYALVVNCAAYTKVDLCETNKTLAFLINGTGVSTLATACATYGVPLMHFSTDYVFDGKKETPYTELDPPCPINVYGESKLFGERALGMAKGQFYLFRIQWLYGNGPCFPRAILMKLKKNEPLRIVSDQYGSPTWARSIALQVTQAWVRGLLPGDYNLCAKGYTSWYDFSLYMKSLLASHSEILPISTTDLPNPAKRPLNGRLSLNKIAATGLFDTLPTWQDDFKAFHPFL